MKQSYRRRSNCKNSKTSTDRSAHEHDDRDRQTWSAVALQQHMTRELIATGKHSLFSSSSLPSSSSSGTAPTSFFKRRSHLLQQTNRKKRVVPSSSTGSGVTGANASDAGAGGLPIGMPAPSLLPKGKLSLAQRMGLAPRPPAPPDAESWTSIESTAARRGDMLRYCGICREPFDFCEKSDGDCVVEPSGAASGLSSSSSKRRGRKRQNTNKMALLNCTHVFHEHCIAQFERCARRVGHQVRCPICRHPHYHRREVTARSKAEYQRHCLVRLQSLVRGFLARKKYLKLRFKCNPQFRQEYYYQTLRRYADSQHALLRARQEEIDEVIDLVDLRRQKAAAMMLDGPAWENIKATAVVRILASSRSIGVASEEQEPTSSSSAKEADEEDEDDDDEDCEGCSICLGELEVMPYAAQSATVLASPLLTNDVISRIKAVMMQQQQQQQTDVDDDGSQSPNRKHTKTTKRAVIVTSCGHTFHADCLKTFESFSAKSSNEKSDKKDDDDLFGAARCPVCRSGFLSQMM